MQLLKHCITSEKSEELGYVSQLGEFLNSAQYGKICTENI